MLNFYDNFALSQSNTMNSVAYNSYQGLLDLRGLMRVTSIQGNPHCLRANLKVPIVTPY